MANLNVEAKPLGLLAVLARLFTPREPLVTTVVYEEESRRLSLYKGGKVASDEREQASHWAWLLWRPGEGFGQQLVGFELTIPVGVSAKSGEPVTKLLERLDILNETQVFRFVLGVGPDREMIYALAKEGQVVIPVDIPLF